MDKQDFDELGQEPKPTVDQPVISTEQSRVAKTSQSADLELEQALVALPKMPAPRHTLARVMARIASLPQLETDMAALSIAMAPPKIKYVPPVVEMNQEAASMAQAVGERSGGFNPLGYLFIGLWATLCLTVGYLLWPGISYLIFGPSQNPDMQARLVALQNWWHNLTTNFSTLFATTQPYLLTIVSALVGVAILLYIVTQQQHRTWLDN